MVIKGEPGACLGARAIQGLSALRSPFAFDYFGQRGDHFFLCLDGTGQSYKTGMSHHCLFDLDLRCEDLIKEEFGERCNFDVDDAVQKLEKLGIIARDSIGRYYCMGLKRANDIIGTTTEELVLKAKQVGGTS
uniref:Uncharacterized protein n=1 Tax=Fagus sylvatica TaxID=28930 RepID=A0A2N9J7C0_FAGSY